MSKLSFREFGDQLDRAVERIPMRFTRNLTGGFNVQQEIKREDDYYILGEYIEDDMLGCFIMFYYGSFAAILNNEPYECWQKEIMDTVLHELQHHLESLAGRDDLAQKEIAELAQALQEERQ